MTNADAMLTLAEAAAIFPNDAVTPKTLRLRIRQGKLVAYRPGKAYLTTRAHVLEMVEQCRVSPKVRDCGSVPLKVTIALPLGLSETALASAALEQARVRLRALKKR